jgi:hypothetical protein
MTVASFPAEAPPVCLMTGTPPRMSSTPQFLSRSPRRLSWRLPRMANGDLAGAGPVEPPGQKAAFVRVWERSGFPWLTFPSPAVDAADERAGFPVDVGKGGGAPGEGRIGVRTDQRDLQRHPDTALVGERAAVGGSGVPQDPARGRPSTADGDLPLVAQAKHHQSPLSQPPPVFEDHRDIPESTRPSGKRWSNF